MTMTDVADEVLKPSWRHPQLALGRVQGRMAGRDRWSLPRIRATPIRTPSSRISRPRCGTGRASTGRMSGAAGSSAVRARTTAAAATSSSPMEWDEVLDLLAEELARVRDTHGLAAIFGGSYGWASAGRFHHAQSQIHRFLNTALGGYVRSVNSYSAGASNVHAAAYPRRLRRRHPPQRGLGRHRRSTPTSCSPSAAWRRRIRASRPAASASTPSARRWAQARARGTEFVLVSPQRTDLPAEAEAEWIAPIPGTDTALMLGHRAHAGGGRPARPRIPRQPLHRLGRVRGLSDGPQRRRRRRSAAWAAPICGDCRVATIEALARRLAGKRVLIVVSHSMQRSEHGEQPVWMGAVLAAMLGQIGLPGGGYNYALGAVANYGKRSNAVPVAALPQGQNGVARLHSGRAHLPTCCSIRASRSTTTASG